MATAFQQNAFQNNAFQIDVLTGDAFQCDAFQTSAFQMPDCGSTPPAVANWWDAIPRTFTPLTITWLYGRTQRKG